MTDKIHRSFLTALAFAALALFATAHAAPAHATEITDPEECSDADGRWGNYGGTFECNLSTLDGGRECSGDDDCESVCITDDNVPIGTQTSGHCYDWTVLRDTCMNYVSEGVVTGLRCVESP